MTPDQAKQPDMLARRVWRCKRCLGLNKLDNTECFSCATPRPEPMNVRMELAAIKADTEGWYKLPCKDKPKPAPTRTAKPSKASEAELQRECEYWLMDHGYLRLTPENAKRGIAMRGGPRGWFAHLVKAERNPLMPDLMIYSADMRHCVGIELKAKKHKWQPGQREMVTAGLWRLAFDVRQLAEIVETWEVQV